MSIGVKLRGMLRTALVSASAIVSGYTRVQVCALEREVLANVVLLLPPGYVARPRSGAPIMLLSRTGESDTLLGIGGAIGTEAQTDLSEGEYGLKSQHCMVLLRNDGLHITSDLDIWINGQNVHMSATTLAEIIATQITLGPAGAALRALLNDHALQVYNAHTHVDSTSRNTSTPTQQMAAGVDTTQTVTAH